MRPVGWFMDPLVLFFSSRVQVGGDILPNHAPPDLTVTANMSIEVTEGGGGNPQEGHSPLPSLRTPKMVDTLNCCLDPSPLKGGGGGGQITITKNSKEKQTFPCQLSSICGYFWFWVHILLTQHKPAGPTSDNRHPAGCPLTFSQLNVGIWRQPERLLCFKPVRF